MAATLPDDLKELEADAARFDAEVSREDAERKKLKKEKKSKKEHATFNQLDERFQLLPGMDLEHIFPDEKAMVEELRSKIPDLIYFSDKWIVFFLCARRHDLEETAGLIERHLALRREYNVSPKDVPDIFAEPECVKMIESRVAYRPPHSHDRHGRLIAYYWMARNFPKGRPLRAMLMFSFWETDWLVETEPLAYLRNGTIWLMNQKDFSLMKNVDTSPAGKAWGNALTGNFPVRIRDIYMWNTGMLFSVVLRVARWVMPKKLTKRMHNISKDDLPDLVPREFLLEEYGGDLKLDWDGAKDYIEKSHKRLLKSKKAIRKAVRELKKELKAELAGVDELNASTEALAISNSGPHTAHGH